MKKYLITLIAFIILNFSNVVSAQPIQHVYDSANRIESVNLPDGRVIKYFFDVGGNLLKKIADDNLLVNGDFEAADMNGLVASHWRHWESIGAEGEYKLVQNPVSSGRFVQKIDAKKIPQGAMNIYQDIKVTPNQTYTVTGRLSIERMQHAEFMVAIHYFDANYNLVGAETPFKYGYPASWLTFTGTMTPPAKAAFARIQFHIQESAANGHGTVYVDGVKVKRENNPNLFFNPGFESISSNGDSASGWSVWQSVGSEGDVRQTNESYRQGLSSQVIDVKKMPQGAINFYQDIPVTPETEYHVAADVKVAQLSNAAFVFSLHYFDQNYKVVGADIPVTVNTLIDWSSVGGRFIPPEGAKIVRVHFHMMETGSGGSGKVFVDNAQLYKHK